MKPTISVTQTQLDLLIFIAKYRFVTVSHIQHYFGYKSRASVNNKLNRMAKTGLVGMRYDSSKKLLGIPAAFYATPAGLRAAKTKLTYITDSVIRASYSDKDASESLIAQSSDIFKIAQSLTRNYPNMNALTARQLGDLEYFPRPLPSLYLAHKQPSQTVRYFLYHFREVIRYDVAVKSTMRKITAYREADTYAESGSEFPIILFVCDSAAIERLAQRTIRTALSRSYESTSVYTTSYQALIGQINKDQPIWSSIDDPDRLITLENCVE